MMQQPPSKPIPMADIRHDARRPAGRGGWMLVEGGGPPHPPPPPPWAIHNGHQPPPSDPGLLKQVNQGAHQPPYGTRFHPYGLYQRHHLQFTVHDLDKCLYGKQELRVVQIGENTSPTGAATKSASSSASTVSGAASEDKNKPAKWCDMCQEIRFGECPQHGPLPSLRPTINLPGPKSYAVSTFPDEVGLCISTLPLAGYGVFARHFIPMGTWIGPYEGKKIPVEEGLKQISQGDAPFLWEIYENFRLSHFLDASDENASSWMRFIQCARHRGEQNLFVFQYYGSIYYRAFKDILIGCELLVWYDDKYPQYFGMPYDIRDMSSYSMESIQAPMEVSKAPDFDPTRPHHGERPHPPPGPFIHKSKMIASSGPGARVERSEPPRIPPNGHIHPQSIHGHVSSNFQPPPAQPPTLSQAPSIIDTRSAHSSVHVTASRNHPHVTIPHGHSPRPSAINPAFRRDPLHSTSNMSRSMSAEDLRKRNTLHGPVSERPLTERELLERVPHSVEHASHHPPPPGLLGPHMNIPPGAIAHYSTAIPFPKLPPSVMSVTPIGLEHSKANSDGPKLNELKLLHDRDRLVMERDRMVREHERVAQERERTALDRGRPPLDRVRPPPERILHEGPGNGEPWEIYRCQGCGQSFNQKANLEKHHCVTEAAKPYQCGRCQLSFQEPHDLQEHMVMHTAERPFKCGVCSRSFSGTSALSSHMRMHSTGLNEQTPPTKEVAKPPLDCQKCGKRFMQIADMNKHLTTPGECTS